MLWTIGVTHAVGNASDRQFFTEIEMAIGHKDFPGRSVLLLERPRPYLRMALVQLRRITPGAGQITAHCRNLAAGLVHLEHAGFEQIQVVEIVKICMKQLFTRQIDVIESAVATASEWRDALVRRVVDGEMRRH